MVLRFFFIQASLVVPILGLLILSSCMSLKIVLLCKLKNCIAPSIFEYVIFYTDIFILFRVLYAALVSSMNEEILT